VAKFTVNTLRAAKREGRKITALTAYDALFAAFLDESGIDIVLVGDSVGMVVSGYETTLPVTVEEMIYHGRAVRRSVKDALLVVDMPFMSYQVSVEDALRNIGRVMKETGAECVKVEGAGEILALVQRCSGIGIPVMGHLGMTPQSVHRFGGYTVQGRGTEAAERLLRDAQSLQEAGVCALVLEKVPAPWKYRPSALVRGQVRTVRFW